MVNGVVWCWGVGNYGQLGGGSTSEADVPKKVIGLDTLFAGTVSIDTNLEHACAYHELHGIRCWGRKGDGALGNGESEDIPTPQLVGINQPHWTALASGATHTCGVASNELWCWGLNGLTGKVGTDRFIENSPQPVGSGGTPSSVGAGGHHSCSVVFYILRCWGHNGYYQLGRDSETIYSTSTPMDVPGMSTVHAVFAGARSTCAVNSSGALVCWGNNSSGELGNGTDESYWQPQQVHAGPVSDASLGVTHTCIVVNGGVACSGDDSDGELGNGVQGSSLGFQFVDDLPPGSGATSIASGYSHSCAVVDGGVMCWGLNMSGQLGVETVENSQTPVWVTGILPGTGATDVAAGAAHTCAVVAGAMKCWGAGSDGQLGNGLEENAFLPQDVIGLADGVTALSLGESHSCAIRQGALWCWGESLGGKLGGFQSGIRTAPVGVVTQSVFGSGFEDASQQ